MLLRQFSFCLFCILLFGTISVFLGQDLNLDLLQYHFYNGYALLHHRYHQDVMPALMQTYLNPFFDVINYLLISLQKPRITEFLLGAFSGVTCFLLYQIAVILFGNLSFQKRNVYALFSTIIGMTGAANISLLNTTMNDNKMSLLIVVSLYCMLQSIVAVESAQKKYLMLSALMIGLATGFKLTAICYAVGLFLGLGFSGDGSRRHLYSCGWFVIFVVIGFLLANGAWMVYLYQRFQNPLFPYYNNIFHSAYAIPFSFNISPNHGVFHPAHESYFLPFYLAASKNILTSESALRDMRFFAVFLLAMMSMVKAVCWRTTNKELDSKLYTAWFCMFIYFFSSYFVWLVAFSVYRYALPLELISGLLIVFMVSMLVPTQWLQRLLLCMIVCIFAMTTSYPDWGKGKYGNAYFAMTPPALPSSATVLFLTQSLSYTIPFFSADVGFIGMPFIKLGEQGVTGHHHPSDSHGRILMQMMDALVKNKNNTALYTLGLKDDDDTGRKTLAILEHFGLVQDKLHCSVFSTNVGDTLKLCPLKRNNNTLRSFRF